MYKSKYLISKNKIFTWLFLLNLFININFLFKQTIEKIETQIILIVTNKMKKKTSCKVAYIRIII